MRILIPGGSGYLGSLVLPYIVPEHFVRVLDLIPPKQSCGEYVEASVLDSAAMAEAMAGMDGMIYCALGYCTDGPVPDQRPSFDINVTATYLCFDAAQRAGVRSTVYISTLTIYSNDGRPQFIPSEDRRGDSKIPYGLVKYLGEQVARHFAEHRGMITTTLRLDSPKSIEDWQKGARENNGYTTSIAAPDVADAMIRALRRTEPGYQVLFTTGDWEQRKLSLERAQRVLGWKPMMRPADPA